MEIIIHTDGGARGNPGPAAAGFCAFHGDKLLEQQGKFLGEATNNVAEYQAVLLSLDWLSTQSLPERVIWKLDSLLVVSQLGRHWKIKEPALKDLAAACWQKLVDLKLPYQIVYVPRRQNACADAQVNLALDQAAAQVQ